MVDINNKHPCQQVPGQGVDVCGNLIPTCLDFGKERSHVLVIKGEPAGEESKEDDTATPNVSRVSSVLVASDDLGTGIMRTATTRFKLKGGRCEGGHSPVGDFYQWRVE